MCAKSSKSLSVKNIFADSWYIQPSESDSWTYQVFKNDLLLTECSARGANYFLLRVHRLTQIQALSKIQQKIGKIMSSKQGQFGANCFDHFLRYQFAPNLGYTFEISARKIGEKPLRPNLTSQTERFKQSWFLYSSTHAPKQPNKHIQTDQFAATNYNPINFIFYEARQSKICDQNYSQSFSFILCDVFLKSRCDVLFPSLKRYAPKYSLFRSLTSHSFVKQHFLIIYSLTTLRYLHTLITYDPQENSEYS